MEKQNAHNKKLENAFDYSLKLLSLGASIEDCLKLYPAQEEELKGLLETAMSVQGAYPSYPEIKPSKLFMKTNKEKFLAAIENGVSTSIPAGKHAQVGRSRESVSTKRNVAKLFRNAYITAGAAAAALIVAIGGLVGISQNSLPGNPLYAVKRASENVQIALTFDAGSRDKLDKEFAQKRVDETRLIDKLNSDSSNNEKSETNTGDAKKLARASSDNKQGEEEARHLSNEAKRQANNAVAGTGETSENMESTGNESGADEINTGEKVAVNTDNSSIASGDAVSDRVEEERTDAQETHKRKPSTSEVISESKSSAAISIPPFEIAEITVSSEYVNPFGSALKDKVSICISGASCDSFRVELYKGSAKYAIITEQSTGRNLEIAWNGKDVNGNRVEDGEYTVRVVDLYGQLASKRAKITIDATPPSISLVTPPDGIVTYSQAPQFVWEGGSADARYTLYLLPAGDLKDKARCITGLTNPFYEPTKELKFGTWMWRVVGEDRAGNIGSSANNKLIIENLEEKPAEAE